MAVRRGRRTAGTEQGIKNLAANVAADDSGDRIADGAET
jgi:hypothetical protein